MYHGDGLGSVRAITDSGGSVTQAYERDEFGVPTSTQGASAQPFGYTGEQRDAESSFIYLRAHMYEPGIGRFLQQDPVAGDTVHTQSLNRYPYALSNPGSLVDPSGLWCTGPAVGATAEVGVGVLGAATTAGFGTGLCAGGPEGPNLGAFAQGGAYAGTPWGPAQAAFPEGTGNASLGAYVGVGAGPFVSNATSFCQLGGPFETVSIDVGIGPIKGSVQISWSGGTWIGSVTAGRGIGVGVTKLQTTTYVPGCGSVPTPRPLPVRTIAPEGPAQRQPVPVVPEAAPRK